MKHILILALLLISTAYAHAQDIAGDWQGALSAGGQTLRLVLHLTKAADNSLKATIDSLDQAGANGIPVASVTLKDSKLTLDVAVIHASYDAKVSSDAKTISGTWSSRRPDVPARVQTRRACRPSKPSDIDGSWMGTARPRHRQSCASSSTSTTPQTACPQRSTVPTRAQRHPHQFGHPRRLFAENRNQKDRGTLRRQDRRRSLFHRRNFHPARRRPSARS